MSATQTELDSFHQFASAHLQVNGGADSLEQLLTQWRAAREREEVNRALRQAFDEMNAGLGRPLDELIAEYQQRYGTTADA